MDHKRGSSIAMGSIRIVLYPSPSPSNCNVISIMFSFACQSQKQHVSQWKITCLVNKTSLLGSMEMYSYYEEGTCAWLLVFKCSQCTFNMLFPLVFDSTDVTFSYLYFVFSFIFRFFATSWPQILVRHGNNLKWKFTIYCYSFFIA